MNTELIIDVSCLEHTYPGGVRVDVCGVAFQVRRGQRVAILGPNGSGKSTLLKHVLGLLTPTKGQVRVFGEDPARHYDRIRGKIGTVLQNVDEQLIGPTVFDDIAFAPLNFGFSREETMQRVETILQTLDIAHLRDRLPHYLSGGERKKVALAGALVFDPELLILDEPLEGVDYASRLEISHFLHHLHHRTAMTIVSTTHDMEQVSLLADVVYLMRAGGRVELYGNVTDLFFQHDLRDFNIAPPVVVQLIQELARHGRNLPPTLDLHTLIQHLLERMPADG
ncbi:MAG: energy-coupling factor ABC transporter ATP-binding protein [Chloroflexi bacterium]|nr:energy-coupling factor ABC transporter ATP-binding protein [Chloroflexota bacterium]